MIVALVLFLIAIGIIGAAVMMEARQRAQIEAARDIGNYARRAQNLSQALSVMPRGYLPRHGVLKLLDEIEHCAKIMAKSGQTTMETHGRTLKSSVAEQREEIEQTGATGPATANITSKQRVEVIREAAKYLHGFFVKKFSRNAQYCEGPQEILTALDFSRCRVVVDFFNNAAKHQLKEYDPYKARLALERAAGLLKPWAENVTWASHAYQDYSKRVRQLADAQPKTTGSEKQWSDWEAENDWKKKPVYD